MNAGFAELIFILVILVVVFGARWMPIIGQSLGRAIYKMRKRHKVVEIK